MSGRRESGLLHFVLYQAGWFACVLGAAHGRPWAGTLAGLALLASHLALIPERRRQARFLLEAGLLGAVVDSAQSCLGLLTFRSGYVAGCLAPPWIVVMWMQFATLYRFGLSFLVGRPVLAACLGAVGGPLAFWAGHRLGAVSFADPPATSLAALAAVWAFAVCWLGVRSRNGKSR